MYLRKSISLLEALKDEAMLEDLALYYCKLGTVLISQGGGGGEGLYLRNIFELLRRSNLFTIMY